MRSLETTAELMARVGDGYPSSLRPSARELISVRVVLAGTIDQQHLAGNGFVHAGAFVTLADTACGFETLAGLPEGAAGFTTVELKSNHVATLKRGEIVATATRAHGGRTTQVWDAEITDAQTGRTLVLFRCTQVILYPR